MLQQPENGLGIVHFVVSSRFYYLQTSNSQKTYTLQIYEAGVTFVAKPRQ